MRDGSLCTRYGRDATNRRGEVRAATAPALLIGLNHLFMPTGFVIVLDLPGVIGHHSEGVCASRLAASCTCFAGRYQTRIKLDLDE